ncbi:hypothetical protein NX059_003611 [Plenodomus lindquistii]|nr:hypothetical protein NX059_003611 [Plenodomus lindquistii]
MCFYWVLAVAKFLAIVIMRLFDLSSMLRHRLPVLVSAALRLVVAKFGQRLRLCIWQLWGTILGRIYINGVKNRLYDYALLSWTLAKGRSTTDKLMLAFDFLRNLPFVLYTALTTPSRHTEYTSPATSTTDSVYLTPNLVPLLDNDDDNDISLPDSNTPSLLGLQLGFGGQPSARDHYVQHIINQEHLDAVYATGLLDEESDSGDEQDFMYSPTTSSQRESITGPEYWSDGMAHQASAA